MKIRCTVEGNPPPASRTFPQKFAYARSTRSKRGHTVRTRSEETIHLVGAHLLWIDRVKAAIPRESTVIPRCVSLQMCSLLRSSGFSFPDVMPSRIWSVECSALGRTQKKMDARIRLYALCVCVECFQVKCRDQTFYKIVDILPKFQIFSFILHSVWPLCISFWTNGINTYQGYQVL